MRLPRFIKVGTSRYKFTRDPSFVEEEDGDVFGLTDHQSHTVFIAPGMGAEMTANVAIHEVLHVLIYKAGIDFTQKQEEQIVTQLTPVVVDFIRDNIGLINFVINHKD